MFVCGCVGGSLHSEQPVRVRVEGTRWLWTRSSGQFQRFGLHSICCTPKRILWQGIVDVSTDSCECVWYTQPHVCGMQDLLDR